MSEKFKYYELKNYLLNTQKELMVLINNNIDKELNSELLKIVNNVINICIARNRF